MIKPNKYKFHEKHIEFEFYNLNFSSLHKNKYITLDRIKAIDLKSYPQSLIIDDGEIIFLNHDDNLSLQEFGIRNQIPESSHIDTWSILTRNYLDTELDKSLINEQNIQLSKVGIDEIEFKRINKKIKWTLIGTMEWNYLGLWDLLAMKQFRNPLYKYRLLGKKFYWEAMKIALKGSQYYKSSS